MILGNNRNSSNDIYKSSRNKVILANSTKSNNSSNSNSGCYFGMWDQRGFGRLEACTEVSKHEALCCTNKPRAWLRYSCLYRILSKHETTMSTLNSNP